MSSSSLIIIYPWHLIEPAARVLHRYLTHSLSELVRHLPNGFAGIQVLPEEGNGVSNYS